jgi:hypothetical protein
VSSFAVEQIQEQMRQLKLVRTAEQLPLLLGQRLSPRPG